MLPVDLILGDDDLAWIDVTGVGDGVTQNADESDHLTRFADAIHNVAGVTDELFAPCNLWWKNIAMELKKNKHMFNWGWVEYCKGRLGEI